jgi:hypothetical protein
LGSDCGGRFNRGRGDRRGSIARGGGRWFRRAGDMTSYHCSQSSKPLSGRYPSFAERDEIAILRVSGAWCLRRCLKAWARPFDDSRELRRNPATRYGGLEYRATTAQWHADRSSRRPNQPRR